MIAISRPRLLTGRIIVGMHLLSSIHPHRIQIAEAADEERPAEERPAEPMASKQATTAETTSTRELRSQPTKVSGCILVAPTGWDINTTLPSEALACLYTLTV
jgi:hypothetical protein